MFQLGIPTSEARQRRADQQLCRRSWLPGFPELASRNGLVCRGKGEKQLVLAVAPYEGALCMRRAPQSGCSSMCHGAEEIILASTPFGAQLHKSGLGLKDRQSFFEA